MFVLHPAFPPSSHAVGDLGLCHVRLQADRRWPWLVLIPRRDSAREIEDLPPAERGRLMEESILAGQAVRAVGEAVGFPVSKLNLGALGNITPQLHVHVVGRREGDPAWPGPVWGVGAASDYELRDLDRALSAARAALGL